MICTWSPVGIFSNSSFIYEKPGINRDKQAKENKTQHKERPKNSFIIATDKTIL